MGKEPLHDVSASATKPASAGSSAKKAAKTEYFGILTGELRTALTVSIYFFYPRCETAALLLPDAVLRCAPAGNAFLAAIFASRAAAAV